MSQVRAATGILAQRLAVGMRDAIRRPHHLAGVRREQPVAHVLHVRAGDHLEAVALRDLRQRHPQRRHHLPLTGQPIRSVCQMVFSPPTAGPGEHLVEEEVSLLRLHHSAGRPGQRAIEREFAELGITRAM